MTEHIKKSRKAPTVAATPRDRAVLQFIGQGGIASINQIQQGFFELANERTVIARMRQLERAGWVTSHRIDVRKPGERLFTLTPKGARDHFSWLEWERFIIGLPGRGELYQQLQAQQARLVLEEQNARSGFKLADWKNERELRAAYLRLAGRNKTRLVSKSCLPDAKAVFINLITGEIRKFTLEVDSRHYQGRLLSLKLDSFIRLKPELVWVTTHNRAERIQAELKTRQATDVFVLAVQ